MKAIKYQAKKIEDELKDADEYIDKALEVKDSDPESAAMYYELSLDELKHSDKIHADVVRHINEYKQKVVEIPKDVEAMMSFYNFMHERHMADAMQIKVKQSMYKAE